MSDMPVTLVEDKSASNRRTAMFGLYALHTLAWATAGTFALIALVINYVLRSDEKDPLYVAHHGYMIRTFWWTLFWLVLLSPLWLLLVLPGALAYLVVGLWYLYRCIRGWVRFANARLP